MGQDEAFQIAEQKIEAASRAKATELDLSGPEQESASLIELPESLGHLTQLQSLDISNNRLTKLPEWLGQLTELRKLTLYLNKLTSLPVSLGRLTRLDRIDVSYNDLPAAPECLGQLQQLKSLNLSNNKLTSLPEWVGGLSNLKSLDVSRNLLKVLPQTLSGLSHLKSLDVSRNQLTVLPESLRMLVQLESLDLGGNKQLALDEWLGEFRRLTSLNVSYLLLAVLPEWVSRLTQLQALTISGNELTELPDWIGSLKELAWLDLDRNLLTELPEWLGQLKRLRQLYVVDNRLTSLPKSLSKLADSGVLASIFLHNNPGLGLPREVLGPSYREQVGSGRQPPKPAKEILDYYFSTRGVAGQALGELRLIVVGRPKAGKTSLVKRLRGQAMDLNEVETHGIDIQPLNLNCPGGVVRARVWDFGGQHVLHAMHEFFLRSRCLYLLVVEQRVNDVERDLTYWLQLIRSYAGDAPVVVALNQSKGIPRSLARAALERDYGPIFAWVPTECAAEKEVPGANATIEELRRALTAAADLMPEPKKLFPRKWLEIKEWLEGMSEPYLEYAAYAKHCSELREGDAQQQAALAAVMDELGVALNYARDPRLHDTTVLRPNWLANGIYALLRANILTARPLAPDGVLTEKRVGEILAVASQCKVLKAAEYPPEKWLFLLRLMNLFQLSFPLDERGQRCLVPVLLPADEPPLSGEPSGPGLVKLRYEFDVVPGPLVGRLLVRLFALVDERRVWQRGARLRYAGAEARVWADLNETYVYATVAGSARDRDELLSMIREALKEMFREYQRLRVVEQLWYGNDWVPRAALEKFGVVSSDRDSEEVPSGGAEARRED